jgi:hypothetical protein
MATPQQQSVDAWNASHETAVPVTYRQMGEDVPTKTRSKAVVLSGVASIFIDGVSGCVALDRVTVRT